jgi:endoglucanase
MVEQRMNRRDWLSTSLAGLTALGAATPRSTLPAAARRGVSLAGAEFGVGKDFCNDNPGVCGRDYTYNSERTFAYFAGEGLTLFRIPFRWERMQLRLGEALDVAELGRLREVVVWARRHRSTVILDVHNYARYRLEQNGKIVEARIDEPIDGTVPVSRRHFADLWRRLSAAFQQEAAVAAYGLMNEPHDLGTSDWKAISQAAVDAIRATGDRKLILVCGDGWGNAHRFAEVNGPTAWIKDPAGAVSYEAHCYFDANASGEYRKSYEVEQAADRNLHSRAQRRQCRMGFQARPLQHGRAWKPILRCHPFPEDQ